MNTEAHAVEDAKILALFAAQLAVMRVPDLHTGKRAISRAIHATRAERDRLCAGLTVEQVLAARVVGGVVARLCGSED